MNKYKKCVFTVITGNYDNLMEPQEITPEWDYICFTDNLNLTSSVWEIHPVNDEHLEIECPKRRANAVVMQYFDYIPTDYDICVYIDGNVLIKKNLDRFLERFNYDPKKHDLMIADHPDRKCIFDEATAIINLNKDNRNDVSKHRRILSQKKYPKKNGLYETNKMVFTRNSEKLNDLMDHWFKVYMELPSKRDHMSLNYAIWDLNNGINILSPPPNEKRKGKERRIFFDYLEINNHANHCEKNVDEKLKIFENTPYREDKNLIQAYNSFMKLLPEDGWALFRDADTLFLDPFYGEIIIRAIQNNPNVDCFTCYTNRIGNNKQLYDEYKGDDISKHRTIAANIKEQNYNTYESFDFDPKKSALSGMLFVLSKRAWKRIGGFKKSSLHNNLKTINHNILGVDNQLHKDLSRYGLKTMIIKEMYVYHWYRGGGTNKEHLNPDSKYIPDKAKKTPVTKKRKSESSASKKKSSVQRFLEKRGRR